jgi:hypothetical protein
MRGCNCSGLYIGKERNAVNCHPNFEVEIFGKIMFLFGDLI